jgi:hypothetical protein
MCAKAQRCRHGVRIIWFLLRELGDFETFAARSRTYPPESMAIFAQLPWSKWTISPVFGSGDCPNTPPVLVGLEIGAELRGLMVPKTAVAIVCHRTGRVAQT